MFKHSFGYYLHINAWRLEYKYTIYNMKYLQQKENMDTKVNVQSLSDWRKGRQVVEARVAGTFNFKLFKPLCALPPKLQIQ